MTSTSVTTDVNGNFSFQKTIPLNAAGVYSFIANYQNLKTIVNITPQNTSIENIISNTSLNQLLQSSTLSSKVTSVNWNNKMDFFNYPFNEPLMMQNNIPINNSINNLTSLIPYTSAYLQRHTYHDQVTYDESYYMQHGGKSFADWSKEQFFREPECIDNNKLISYGINGLICGAGLYGGQVEFCVPLLLSGAIDFNTSQVDMLEQRGVLTHDQATKFRSRNLISSISLNVIDLAMLSPSPSVPMFFASVFSDIYDISTGLGEMTNVDKRINLATMTPECVAATIRMQNGNSYNYLIKDQKIHTMQIGPYNRTSRESLDSYNFDLHIYNSNGKHNGRNNLIIDSLDTEIQEVFHSGLGTNIQSAIIVYPNDTYSVSFITDSFFSDSIRITNFSGDSILFDTVLNATSTSLNPYVIVIKADSGIVNNISLSVQNYEMPSQVLIYPNPASDLLTIVNKENISDILIYSITGQLLIQQKLHQQKSIIDISSLTKGIYLLKLRNHKEIITKKFIKE